MCLESTSGLANIEFSSRPELTTKAADYYGLNLCSNKALRRRAATICWADPTVQGTGTFLFQMQFYFPHDSWDINKQKISINQRLWPISAGAVDNGSAGESEFPSQPPRSAIRHEHLFTPRSAHYLSDPVFGRLVSSSSVSPNPARGLPPVFRIMQPDNG